MRSHYNARDLGELLRTLPPFYFVESKTLLQVLRVDPMKGSQMVWGTIVHNDDGSPRINWHANCPAPQLAVIPAPPPDLTNQVEFPTARIQETISKLQAELKRRSGGAAQ